MNRLLKQVEYDKKVAELGKMVEAEAKKLQDAIQSKDVALLEARTLGERKAVLLGQIRGLELKIAEKEKSFSEIVAREKAVVAGIRQEAVKEEASLGEVKIAIKVSQRNLDVIVEENKSRLNEAIGEKQRELEGIKMEIATTKKNLPELTKTYQALKDEVKKAEKTQKEHSEWLAKISSLETRQKGLEEKQSKEREALKEKHQELEELKKYLADLHGKMGSYVQVINDTVKFANDWLEKYKTPIKFKEVVEVDFNNFYVKAKSDS